MKHLNVPHLLTPPRQRAMGFPSPLYRLPCTRTRKVWTLCPRWPANSLVVAGLSHRRGEKDHCILPAQAAPALLYKPTVKRCDVLLWGHLNHALQGIVRGQNSSPISFGTWNSAQPQGSSTFWRADLCEKPYPFLCTVIPSAKPPIESKLKVPYASRSNTTHRLLCTQHEPATSTTINGEM